MNWAVSRAHTAGFEELHDCPDGNVLKCWVRICEKSEKVGMQATVGLVPDVIESRIIFRGCSAV